MAPAAIEVGDRQLLILRAGLFALLIAAPIPFGGVPPSAVLALEIYAAVLGLLALILVSKQPRLLSTQVKTMVLPVIVVLAIGLVQLIPGGTTWFSALVPVAASREAVGTAVYDLADGLAPLSMEAPGTVDALLRLVAYLIVGLSAAVALRSRKHIRQLAVAVSASAVFQALYGSAEYLSGHQHILWYAKQANTPASGTFVNRNHFAGYLAIALAFALALALDTRAVKVAKTIRARVVSVMQPRGLIPLGGWLSAGLIWTAILLSQSRAGLAVALVVCATIAINLVDTKRKVWILLVLLLPVCWLLWQEVQAPGERFFTNRTDLETAGGRTPVWMSCTKIVRAFPILGVGFGSFEHVFDLYRPAEVRMRWEHAHNDWLQSAVEGGVAAFLASCLLLVLLFRLWNGYLVLETCLFAGMIGVVLASTIDFGLRMPAVAATVAVLFGALANSGERNVERFDFRSRT